jgi:acyl carrier protein
LLFWLVNVQPVFQALHGNSQQHSMTNRLTTLNTEIKEMLIRELMLKSSVEDLAEDLPLFGPGGLGLDSVDALQVVIALEKQYGLRISKEAEARDILRTVQTIVAAVAAQTGGSAIASRTE